jgi:hypothetical protein
MFNKNKQKDYHNALANSFNRKKTRENEAKRFQNIHPKINSVIRVDLVKRENEVEDSVIDIPVTNVYKMDSIQTSVSIPLNMRNNDDNVFIPKIELKEIVIPTYSDNDKYDINNINKNINQSIEMDIFNLDDNFDYDISKLYRKKIQTISNVYQESYTENIKPTGFGDFIRGCYFLLQFCSKYKFQPKIIINHPIAVFLEKFYKVFFLNQIVNKPLLRLIPMFTENNWKDSKFDTANYIVDTVTINKTIGEYVNYLCTLKVINNSIFSYNIMFPYDEICEDHKKYVRDLLQPTEEIQLYLDSTLETLEVYKNCYSVIHIRSGDKYLNDDTKIFDTAYFKKLVYEVNILISFNPDINYLLIADNNEIKLLLMERFPCLKAIFKSITHIGEGTVLEREKVKNTMLDFYLMANANSINSYTCYAHGSGFSYWCATTYNIPHKCMFINIK